MWDTASRTLELLGHLQRHGLRTGEELAADMGVTPRTVRRDIARLRDLGYPIDTLRGPEGGYSLEPGAVLPPLFLTAEEAIACTLALRDWQRSKDPAFVASAALKIRSGMADAVAVVADAVNTATLSVELERLTWIDPAPISMGTLGDLARACLARRRVEFGYASRGKSGRRRVEPLVIASSGERWYLASFDLDADEWRTFRIDKISDLTVTDHPSRTRTPPAPDVGEWIVQQVRAGWQRVTATVRFDASAEEVSRAIAPGWGDVVPDSPITCTAHVGADSYDAIATWLVFVGADFTVVEPDALRAALHRLAARAEAAADAPDASLKEG